MVRVVRTLHAIAGALAACHQLQPPLVHRDLQPGNVLMADGKYPRITDFGIGSVVVQSQVEGDGSKTALGARVPTDLQGSGTMLYSPPEQLFGSPPSPRDDVYALGVLAFQMIMGDLQIGPGADAALELRESKVPSELASLIVRSAAMNPDRRPADATEWERVLGGMLAKAKTDSSLLALSQTEAVALRDAAEQVRRLSAEPPPASPGGESRARLGMAALAMVCAGAMGFVAVTQSTISYVSLVTSALALGVGWRYMSNRGA
jgi:serine/threonine protein kinase